MSANIGDGSSNSARSGYQDSLTSTSQRVLRTVGSTERRTRDKLAQNFHRIKDKVYESRIPRSVKTPNLLHVEETSSTVVLTGHGDLTPVRGDETVNQLCLCLCLCLCFGGKTTLITRQKGYQRRFFVRDCSL